ncbi:hypothetical protein LTR62_003223 [Meristemomyces frigidus]|uniref:GTP-binding protein 8 n=1 Tax=Meristemomyces frigidus TaxID=1508187 RepID=A0AAN7YPX2_9PEZI|nr:hypothetical protein LTR62_003223 [Meristemomyces frigidus]
MDIFRLPSPLRRSLLSIVPLHRALTTTTYQPLNSLDPYTPPPLLTLSPTTLNTYNIALPPTGTQLTYAHNFFSSTPPTYLWTSPFFRSFPPSPHPEVAFLGRSNVGKSSLLNALFGRPNARFAHVSKRPGRTRTMNGFGVSGGLLIGTAPREGEREAAWKRFPRGGVVVVDMPGYGGGSREEWGREVMKYLENRKQLRRTFVLVDAEHGLKGSDVEIITHLRRQGIAHQIVVSKVDKLLYPGAKAPGPERLSNGLHKLNALCADMRKELNREAGDGRDSMMDVLCCSSEKRLGGGFGGQKQRRIGVDEVRWAVLSACGLDCDQRGGRRRTMEEDYTILSDEG